MYKKSIIFAVSALGILFLLGLFAYQMDHRPEEGGVSVPIQQEFDSKIVYTGDMSEDPAIFEKDCEMRGGTFNTCGSVCGPDADFCIEMCAYTCELTPQSSQAEIRLDAPAAETVVASPLPLSGLVPTLWTGEELSVVLTNWDGLIIAEERIQINENVAEEGAVFSGELVFESPYADGDPDFMKRGTLIVQKDGVFSEITVFFAEN